MSQGGVRSPDGYCEVSSRLESQADSGSVHKTTPILRSFTQVSRQPRVGIHLDCEVSSGLESQARWPQRFMTICDGNSS